MEIVWLRNGGRAGTVICCYRIPYRFWEILFGCVWLQLACNFVMSSLHLALLHKFHLSWAAWMHCCMASQILIGLLKNNVLWWLFFSSCSITDVPEYYFFHLWILYITNETAGKYKNIELTLSVSSMHSAPPSQYLYLCQKARKGSRKW